MADLPEMRLFDATSGLKSLPDKSVDLIVVDPAYESLEKHRASGTTTRLKKSKASSNQWFGVVKNDYFDEFFAECYRVLKRETYLYVFCDPETLFVIRPPIEQATFEWKKPLIWDKLSTAEHDVICPKCHKALSCTACGTAITAEHGSLGMGYPWRAGYELIAFARKGKRKPPESRKYSDVLRCKMLKGGTGWSGRAVYATEKPTKLLKQIIELSTNPGDLVVDPFAGSGSAGKAAFDCGRRFIGFDIDPEQVAVVQEDFSKLEALERALTPQRGSTEVDLFEVLGVK